MTQYAARIKPKNQSGGEWTQEDKDRFTAQWQTFKAKMAKVQQGQSRDFNVKLLSIGELHPKTSTWQGQTTTKQVRTITVQCEDPNLDMIRFYRDTADNPFFHKTMLNNVLRACGIFPVEAEGLEVSFEDLEGTRLIATIEKGQRRDDGKYAGFYTNVVGYKPQFEDDDTVVAQALVAKPVAKQAPKAAAVEDKFPWEEEDEE